MLTKIIEMIYTIVINIVSSENAALSRRAGAFIDDIPSSRHFGATSTVSIGPRLRTLLYTPRFQTRRIGQGNLYAPRSAAFPYIET